MDPQRYALTFGGLLLLLGRVGDLWGRRRLFVAGLVVFAAASLIGGFAAEPWVLVTARLLQGAAAAAFVPAALSLLTTAFPAGAERDRAVGTYGAMAALGFIVGMVGGGVLTQLLGWRWVMFVNIPVAIAALLLVPVAVAESRDEHASSTVDPWGALTLTAAWPASSTRSRRCRQPAWPRRLSSARPPRELCCWSSS